MARIGSALLALMLVFMTCGTVFAATKKSGGGKSKTSKNSGKTSSSSKSKTKAE
jgi:hypothetical protein